MTITDDKKSLEVANIIRTYKYNYVVVQKRDCKKWNECYAGLETISTVELNRVRLSLRKFFGNETYEDDQIVVYSTGR